MKSTKTTSYRIAAFDVLRSIALFGIVAVHVCYSFPDNSFRRAGQQLGGTFNAVFLLLSALLTGLANKHIKESPARFLARRALRVGIPLWIFLVFFFVAAIAWTDTTIPAAKAAAEFAFLGWPVKLPGLGHLWFVTLILLCYALVFILDHNPALFDGARKEGFIFLATITTSLLFDQWNIPAVQAPLYLFFFGFIWKHATAIFSLAKRSMTRTASAIIATAAFVTLQIGSAIAFQRGLWDKSQMGAYVLGLVAGMSWIIFVIGLLERASLPHIVTKLFSTIAIISYEAYLVHNPFTRIPFPIHKSLGLDSFPARYLFVLIVSLLLAGALHEIATYTRTILSRWQNHAGPSRFP